MSAEILSGPPAPLPGYTIAVLGEAPWADADTLARLLLVLTCRFRDTHQLVLVTAGPSRGRPDILSQRDWSVQLLPAFGGFARQDRELCDWCDAALVIGPAWKWRNLIRLFGEAGKPVRVHADRPPLPRNNYDPLTGL